MSTWLQTVQVIIKPACEAIQIEDKLENQFAERLKEKMRVEEEEDAFN